MFADYERLVLEDYHRKKTDSKLSLGLIFPTPAKLKSECERICSERFNRKDEQIIRDFFGKSGDQRVCLLAIQQCNPDKFRPLIKFLHRGSTKTSEKNIQLLAWLIDFPDRPFVLRKDYTSLNQMQIGVELREPAREAIVDTSLFKKEREFVEDMETGEKVNRATETAGAMHNAANATYADSKPLARSVTQRKRFSKIAIIGALLAITGSGGFWWWDKTQTKDIMPGNGSCMYWADDHYQPIPCNQKIPNTLVVALDTGKVKNFKRITRPDTITHHAKGYVWYSKINSKIEFFTADGEHPLVIGRRLKPISDYIIDKYIRPGMSLK
jgi:hypothetical protein